MFSKKCLLFWNWNVRFIVFGDSILSFDPISVLPNKSFYTTNEVGLITSLFLLQYYLQFRYQRKGGQSNISSLLKEEDEFGKLLFFFNPDWVSGGLYKNAAIYIIPLALFCFLISLFFKYWEIMEHTSKKKNQFGLHFFYEMAYASISSWEVSYSVSVFKEETLVSEIFCLSRREGEK